MKHNRIIAPLLAAFALAPAARENLLNDPRLTLPAVDSPATGSWVHAVAKPAWGTITREQASSMADSVASLDVRYTAAGQPASASMSQTLLALGPKKYRFAAQVKFMDRSSALTLAVILADGTTAASLAASPTADGITPGQWTRVELEADLTTATPGQLQSVTFAFQPAMGADGSLAYNRSHRVLVVHPEVYSATYDGVFSPRQPANGSMESWSQPADTPRQPSGWLTASPGRVAGIYGYDVALAAPADAAITSTGITTGSKVNSLSLAARTDNPDGATITVSVGDLATARAHVAGGRWQTLTFPVASALDDSRVTITADAPLSIDNVNLEPVYGSANPRPAERTLYVTSPDNSGPGSLHDVAAQASAGDLIVIAVDRVNLTEPVDLSSRPVTIDGQGNHIATSACRAFDINPEIASSVTRVTNLVIDCDPDTPMQGAAFNIGDSRNKTAASVDIDSVTVNNAYATANGGAIYLNAPYVTATITNSVFNDCKAAAGAAVASAGGDMTIGWCRFNRCVTTSSTGGAVANVNSRENPLIITACRFDSCSSAATAGGAAAISVNNATQVTRVDNCQFDSNTGGRAAAVNVYCNARSAGGYTTVANCLMLNSREAPAVSVNGGASYTAPTVHLVNNILCLNPSGDITVGRGSVAGDNNLLERPIDGDNSLTRTTIDTSASQTCFAGVTDGTPDRDPATGVYPINPAGAAYAAGTPAYLVGDIDIIPAADINGLDRGGKPSLGPSEQTAFNSGLGHDAVNTPAVNVWPCPATDVIHISGEFTRYRLTSGGGLTLLTSNAPTIDATALPAGLYIITIDTPTGTVTRKITVR